MEVKCIGYGCVNYEEEQETSTSGLMTWAEAKAWMRAHPGEEIKKAAPLDFGATWWWESNDGRYYTKDVSFPPDLSGDFNRDEAKEHYSTWRYEPVVALELAPMNWAEAKAWMIANPDKGILSADGSPYVWFKSSATRVIEAVKLGTGEAVCDAHFCWAKCPSNLVNERWVPAD